MLVDSLCQMWPHIAPPGACGFSRASSACYVVSPEHFPIHPLGLAEHVVEGELLEGLLAAGFAHAPAELGIGDELLQRLGQGVGILGRNEKTGDPILNKLR